MSQKRSGAAALIAAGLVGAMAPALALAQPMTSGQSDYVEHCGGCHGIQGVSAPAKVPQLRGRAGYYLCTPEAREYMARLPNVAHSATSDEQLADILNFVAFDLGQSGKAVVADRYTAAEVGRLRRSPLSGGDLVAMRARLVRQLIGKCRAPTSLMDYFDHADASDSRAGASRQ